MSTAAETVPAPAGATAVAQPVESRDVTANLLRGLKGNTLVPLMLGGAAVVAIVGALYMWASAPTYRVLFNNLSSVDGGRIVNELESRAVPYQFGANGEAILVPADQVHRLRLQLAEQGLPQGGNVGFELMDKQQFGISQFSEQVNFQRSLEGELSRSIESMSPVAQARVHLSMAKPSVFVRDQEPAKASVVLTLHGGRNLGQSQVAAIVHLVSSSVPQLSVDNVTVVDHGGRLLSGMSGDQQVTGENLNYTLELERRYQNRIENILTPLYGAGNVRVQVTADVDFSRREETLESYKPNQGGNDAAVRSTQMSGTMDGANALARGIPGALSNSPPAWEPTTLDSENAQTAENTAAAPAKDDSLRYDNVVNYEVDRNLTHIQHQRGQLERLTVAAVINYRSDVDEEGNAIQVPLSEEEMQQVERLVSQAMGFSAARNDQLEVVNRPFAPDFAAGAQPETEWWMHPANQTLLMEFGRYLLVALIAFIAYRAILRPLLQRHQASAPPKQEKLPAAAADDSKTVAAVADTQSPTPRLRGFSYEADLNQVRDLARDDPRLIAMVVRSWINKDG